MDTDYRLNCLGFVCKFSKGYFVILFFFLNSSTKVESVANPLYER